MNHQDLPSVNALADKIHANYPEDEAVFEERLTLYPSGCFVCTADATCIGYAITHPWLFGHPPFLNSLLGSIPPHADTYYIHDIALIDTARGRHHGTTILAMLKELARETGFHTVTLVAVNHSTSFWESRGFRLVPDSLATEKVRTSYGDDATYMYLEL